MRDDFEISTPELDGFVELAEAAGALADCRRFYAEEGFPDAWREHHQGVSQATPRARSPRPRRARG
jgi:hypothetical protein